ncbi:MAG: RNA ligase family protein [Nocardioidaceae bacterium]
MSPPPPYPRMSYLEAHPAPFLRTPLRVEEKLDGANVALWSGKGRTEVMSRGGPESMDRGRQLGRLRAWAAEHRDAMVALCGDGTVVYAEWLWRRHTVEYDALPDWLVVLDLWRAGQGFVTAETRDERAGQVGLLTPPIVRSDAVLTAVNDALGLLGPARWGRRLAEGIVLRTPTGLRCKVVRPDFVQRSDELWVGELNQLAG